MGDLPHLTETRWQNSFIAAMCRVHEAMGYPNNCLPSQPIDETQASAILQALSSATYAPKTFFQAGRALPTSFIPPSSMPPVDPTRQYVLFRLNVLTRLGVETSIRFGGVVFEDPVLAVAAAWQLRQHSTPTLIARAQKYDSLWAHRAELFQELPDPWVNRKGCAETAVGDLAKKEGAKFDTLVVRGDELLHMREKGARAILVQKQLLLFQLFRPVQDDAIWK